MNEKEKYDFLITNINGVGPAKAKKVLDVLIDEENVMAILEKTSLQNDLLAAVGKASSKSIIEQLWEIKRQDKLVQEMVECGVPYHTATAMVKQEDLFAAFKKDPYTIGRRNDVEFEACDKFAHKQFKDNPPDMSKARMCYFIEAMLKELENSGHTFAYLQQLTRKLNYYQKRNNYQPQEYLNTTLILYLVNNDNVEIERNPIIKKWKIYRKETADLEDDIAYHIKRIAINKTVLQKVPFDQQGMKYDEVQMAAIESVVNSGLKVITGPPGSGKTAVINGIIRYFKEMKPDAKIILCAPTGRAAKHMTEITGSPSSTIHKLLKLREGDDFRPKVKLDCDLLICDEASMLNLDVTFDLLSSIKTGTGVYFVGDKDQLPAVGPGNVLHDIINSEVVPVYHLVKVYRQDGIILENAHAINRGEVPIAENAQYKTQAFDDQEELRKAAIAEFNQLFDPMDPFETQILIPSYKTECGIIAMNKAIQELNPEVFIYKARDEHGYSYKRYDKILMTKNDKDGLYQNGSVGIILANLSDEIQVEFEGEEVLLPKTAIDDMTLGYAISVHKSQGSEYKHVILCLPDEPVNMLKRNIVYTAVTRAKKTIAIYEMMGSMKKAVNTSMELFMQTGLKQKIQKNAKLA